MIMNGYDYIAEEDFAIAWGAHAKPDGNLYRYDEIESLPAQHVWTVSEGEGVDDDGLSADDNWYAAPGIEVVNALGYIVTEKPWDDETPDAIWYLNDDEEAREERRAGILEAGEDEA